LERLLPDVVRVREHRHRSIEPRGLEI
jgi:hypothetical protein